MSTSRTRTSRFAIALAAGALVLGACGSDDDGQVDVPEEGTGNPYTQAIIEADSHDEALLADTSDMVVAVRCDDEAGTATVTGVASALATGTYVGVFEPSTGVDLSMQASGPGYVVGASQMTLDAGEYTVTFADIDEGIVFNVLGCAG